MSNETKKIAIFASFSGAGGVERMLLNLASGIAARGHRVDLVLAKAKSVHLENLPPGVELHRLGTNHTLTSLWRLAAYLRRERPDGLLAAKERACRVAVLAKKLSGSRARLVFRLGTTLSAALEGKSALRKLLWYLPMRLTYPHADAVVGVSAGVRDDLLQITRQPPERFHVIANPVITPALHEKSHEAVEHPWFADAQVPVILGVGRLTRQKDFPTLVAAFAQLRQNRPCHLVLLGEGGDREALTCQAQELGVAEDVAMIGFQPNPYAYLAKASLFVLSSLWEGSPNALTEALAVGTPVVATDCPSGPREILRGGEVAPLVPMGDVPARAAAMATVLDHPPEVASLKAAAAAYTVEQSSASYLSLLLGR